MKLLASKIERTIQNFYIRLQSKDSGVNKIFSAHVVWLAYGLNKDFKLRENCSIIRKISSLLGYKKDSLSAGTMNIEHTQIFTF